MSTLPPMTTFGTPTSTRARKFGGPNGYGHRPDTLPVHLRNPISRFPRATKYGPKGSGKPLPPKSGGCEAFVEASRGGAGILNQFDAGCCTGEATTGAACTDLAAQGTPIPCPSPVASYVLSLCLSRALATKVGQPLPPLTDDGAEPSQNMTALARYGCPPIAVWGNYPPSSKTITQEPTPLQLEAASAWKLLGAHAITSTGDQRCYDVMSTLAAGIPVCFAVEVDGAFEDNTGAVIGAPNANDILGGHYLYAVGYWWDGANLSTLRVRFVNSWDVLWGDRGLGTGNLAFVHGWSDIYVMNVRRAVGGAHTYHASPVAKAARFALVAAAALSLLLALFACRAPTPPVPVPDDDAACDAGSGLVGAAPRCPPCPCGDAGRDAAPSPVPVPPPPSPDAGDLADRACARLVALGCGEGCDGGACLGDGDTCAVVFRKAVADNVTALHLDCVAGATSASKVRACPGPWAHACAGR